jgi:hypothetical protein
VATLLERISGTPDPEPRTMFADFRILDRESAPA